MRRDDTVHGSVHWHRKVVNRKPNEFDAAVTAAIVQRRVAPASNDQAGPALKQPATCTEIDETALRVGHRLCDRYEIVEHVHTGGMGHVYKALDRRRRWGNSQPKHVAIKMLRQSVLDDGCEKLLEREAAKAMQLSHPNIVSVYDYDQHDGQFFIVMEWLSGESLNELLRRTQGQLLSAEYADRIIREVAAAIRYAHRQNIVHADINPANVFITDAQQVKLVDFGVARHVHEDAGDSPTWSTHTYSSPEVLEGQKPTFEDDIFSLACLNFRLRVGRLPFGGLSALEARDSEEELPSIDDLDPLARDRITRGLAYRRASRPQRAGIFARRDWLAHILDGMDRLDQLTNDRWRIVPPIVALVAFLWLAVSTKSTEPITVVEPAVAQDQPATAAPPPTPAAEEAPSLRLLESELERALRYANAAFAEGRLIAPEGNNARALYRDALTFDPTNAAAIAGLQAISNMFADSARAALAENDVEVALADLAHAAETDAANPQVRALTETYEAMGLSALAEARLALAEGAVGRAGRYLNEAERYPNVETPLLRELRAQRNRIAAAQRFQEDLKPLDEHLAAGRLTSPAGDNALGVLRDLKEKHAGNSELDAYSERLAERLLARAALAVAEGRYDEADATLAVAATLGVLEPELAAAQVSLQLARQPQAPIEGAPLTIVTDGARVTVSSIRAIAGPQTPAASDDVAIHELIPPIVPRRAWRRVDEGHVELLFVVNPSGTTSNIAVTDSAPEDVFVASAVDALEQWRFAKRAQPTEASVRITFGRR